MADLKSQLAPRTPVATPKNQQTAMQPIPTFTPSSMQQVPSGPIKPLPLQQTDGKITKAKP